MPSIFDLEAHGSQIALCSPSERLSYTALNERARQFAKNLGEGRFLVFIEAGNDLASAVAYIGCMLAGHVVHLFAGYSEDRLQALIALYNPNYVFRFTGTPAEDTARRHCETLPLHPVLALLLSTSGSTGAARLVKLSRRNLEENAAAICQYLPIDSHDRVLLNLKLSYAYGLSVLHSHLLAGATIVLSELSVADEAFWELLRHQKITSFPGVPYSFELIERVGRLNNLPHLRYVTQAGGRLDPQLVRHFSALGASQGWQFYVMYGQTEAAPRMSYLPPHLAYDHAGCIGLAIPGGRLWLKGEAGQAIVAPDTPGELMYEGPNIMMGYADNLASLALDEALKVLSTGDVACMNAQGLFYIFGRLKRFVKPFGIRVSLDDIEARANRHAPGAAVIGNDKRIVVTVDSEEDETAIRGVLREMAASYALPENILGVTLIKAIPRLPSGKTDYQTLNSLVTDMMSGDGKPRRLSLVDRWRLIVSAAFVKRFYAEFCALLWGKAKEERAFTAVFAELFGRTVSDHDSFRSLAGDSLSYVQASLAIENRLGFLPEHWETMSLEDLESLGAHEKDF